MFLKNTKNWIFKSASNFEASRTNSVILLLFLFPLFVNSIRHWVSSIYVLLFLVSIFSINRKDFHIYKEERIFLVLLIAHVGSVIISNTLAGWTNASLDWFGVEPRYLLAIPIYIFVRQIPSAWKAFAFALPLSAVIIGIHAIIDFLMKYKVGAVEIIYAEGIYGHIYMGNIAALLSVTSFLARSLRQNPGWKVLCFGGAALAACAALLSITRNAWLSLIVLYGVVFVLESNFNMKWDRKNLAIVFSSVGMVALTLFLMFRVDYVQERLEQVYDEPKAYFNADRSKPMEFSSLVYRLEQWRGATLAFLEKPILGHGVGNIGTVGNRLIQEGKLNEVVYHPQSEKVGAPAHVHSAYFEYLADTGIIGLLIIVSMMGYPLFLSLRWRKRSDHAWKFLVLTNTAFLVASLTEIPFIRNNWSSVFLVFNIVFLAWLVNDRYELTQKPAKGK